MSSDSYLPSFNDLRPATPDDLPRIATVAAAGFYYSPTFQFQRPRFANFPEDTVSSYWRSYQSDLRDPATVLLVAEDVWDEHEKQRVYQALGASPIYAAGPSLKCKVVVGVCSINLKPDSWRIGQFPCGIHVEVPEPPAAYNTLERDFSVKAFKLYVEATAPAKNTYLAGKMKLSTLAVHPAYWGRGHATRLVNWCVQLADLDGIPVAVSAAPMGARVAAKAGFEEQSVVQIKRSAVHDTSQQDDSSTTDASVWVAVRAPSRSPSDESTTRSESPVAGLD
ncbi:hypothetical protein CC78DRAFT_14942 [Lojkania enalia]|uniref:N-acetyltransferase domain-containing protein n=1 Tax=Lojkania enalia TaxID=147567 RepID=A0A9P4KHZ4_9PLEO|nr:hypothetical protein CC78DRAFT_14942 [Didymosphaeria enalia]